VVVVLATVVLVVLAAVVLVVLACVVVVVLAAVVVVVLGPVVEVVCGAVVVVVPPPHASQQLDVCPTVADPPCGAVQAAAFRLMLQRDLPCAFVRQQVTNPGLPQVDRAAHVVISERHWGRRFPPWTAAFATCATQLTYPPWLAALAQSHCAAACARTAAT
jgi:hypothetical protein